MIKPDGNVILIDWEYSGYSDPGIDVGYYIVDAMYDFDEAERFIKEYLQDSYTEKRYYHFGHIRLLLLIIGTYGHCIRILWSSYGRRSY